VLGLDAIKLSPPSVLVTGNPALADVSALARLAGCASGDPSGTTGIVLEVHPADQGLKCTLVAWKQVCDYIAAGNTARAPPPPPPTPPPAHPLREYTRILAGRSATTSLPAARRAFPCARTRCQNVFGSLLAFCQALSAHVQKLWRLLAGCVPSFVPSCADALWAPCWPRANLCPTVCRRSD